MVLDQRDESISDIALRKAICHPKVALSLSTDGRLLEREQGSLAATWACWHSWLCTTASHYGHGQLFKMRSVHDAFLCVVLHPFSTMSKDLTNSSH